MQLNELSPIPGSRPPAKRVGRGIGSGSGKTCGRGHKGQKSRSGGRVKPGFEGGQMPIQRRVPKFGFTSRKAPLTAEVRLHELAKVQADVVDLDALIDARVVGHSIKVVRVILSGAIEKPVKVRGLKVTQGAKAAIEAAGGSVED